MRKLNVVAVLGVMLAASAVGAGVANAIGVVSPVQVTSSVTPRAINPPSIKKARYQWTVKGTVVPPKFICPPGVSAPSPYCTKVPPSACSGKVSWFAKLGKNKILAASGKKIGQGTANVSKCAYKFKHKFKTSLFVATAPLTGASGSRHVGVFWFVRFTGNATLKPKSASKKKTSAKILSP